MSVEATFDSQKNILASGESRIVFHCHHYNLFLQRTISDALGERAAALQTSAAAESARRLLAPTFSEDEDLAARVVAAGAFFSKAGFGRADASGLSAEGGVVELQVSHYAVGWEAKKWGAATGPVCHFAAGFWAGALGAALDVEQARITVAEEKCIALGNDVCVIKVGVA